MTIVLSQQIKQIIMEQHKTTGKPAGVAEEGNGNANGDKPRHNFKKRQRRQV